MRIYINGKEYPIRKNFLHRGLSRVVLNTKKGGEFLTVQLNNRTREPKMDKVYAGYLCQKYSFKEVKVVFKEDQK